VLGKGVAAKFKWAATPSTSGNNRQAEAKRRFRIITASFWYQVDVFVWKQPHDIPDRWRLGIQKSPSVYVFIRISNHLLFGFTQFFVVCVFFSLVFFLANKNKMENKFDFFFGFSSFCEELAKVLVDG
jgi:hypothetical protein